MSTEAELLQRHRPFLKYDSHENYFADSAAEWTDNPGNRLLNADGDELAVAGDGLSLGFLGGRYPDGSRARKADRISDPTKRLRRPGARAALEAALRQPRLRPRGERRRRRRVAPVLVLLLLQRLQPDRALHPRGAARGRLGDDPDPPRERAARPRGVRTAQRRRGTRLAAGRHPPQRRSGRSSTSRVARTPPTSSRARSGPATGSTTPTASAAARSSRSRSPTSRTRSSAGCAGRGAGATRRPAGARSTPTAPRGRRSTRSGRTR